MTLPWLDELEAKVGKAKAEIARLRAEVRRLKRRIAELEREGGGAGDTTGWEEERAEVRRRVEQLVGQLTELAAEPSESPS